MNFAEIKSRLKKALSDFIYGFTVHGHVEVIRKQIMTHNFTFMTLLYGDMLGLPLLPPIYKYKLLPYFFPFIELWKREILKDKDFFEKVSESA